MHIHTKLVSSKTTFVLNCICKSICTTSVCYVSRYYFVSRTVEHQSIFVALMHFNLQVHAILFYYIANVVRKKLKNAIK